MPIHPSMKTIRIPLGRREVLVLILSNYTGEVLQAVIFSRNG